MQISVRLDSVIGGIYMNGEKFTLMQYSVNSILGFIEAEDFVIPEIQRPFVWKRSQVRDLIDSLYNGYPTGYIIVWKNPDMKTKDGGTANGKRILIDGQQRITALMAAISGKEVLNGDFEKDRIKIAFNPLEKDSTKRFEVQDASHLRNKLWIPDIAVLFSKGFKLLNFITEYASYNNCIDKEELSEALYRLKEITGRQIGVIELNHALSIDEVTEIFIRINSKGTALSQSDFVMSKMASDNEYGGSLARKAVDYFCHLAAKPEFYQNIKMDNEFTSSKYFNKISWLAKDFDEIFNPEYGDVLRVSFMHKFDRGRLADLVSLLSGRDFKTKEYRDDVAAKSYRNLECGILNFINENNFKNFILALKGAGFIANRLLLSTMTIDFAYTLYLMLHDDKTIPIAQIKRSVQKWFVLSTLTSRYTGSPESTMDRDIRNIRDKGFFNFVEEVEASVLSDDFWKITLPQNLETSSVNSPVFSTFLAAQVNLSSDSLFMKGTKVADLINISGDIHHIFPRAYLKKNGIDSKTKYNQVANYILLDTQINKAIGESPPKIYFTNIKEQCISKSIVIGNIANTDELHDNMKMNCIPIDVFDMDVTDYGEFLLQRRKLMAQLIRRYYMAL